MLGKLERLVISSRSAGDSIAHDLRSPLTRLRNHLEAGLRDTNSEGPRTALARSIEDVDDVLNTFNAVLRLSRVQAGATGSFRRTNVTGITDELAELYQPACEEKSMTFTYAPEGDLFVQADRDLIAQALSNLLDNAVKYTPAGGAVSLAVKRLGASEVELSVSDTGPGIPPEDRDRAVERFVRLEQSRSEPGSGLGLSLVDAVAEAHRGRLLLDSAGGTPPNIGLAARLILPSA